MPRAPKPLPAISSDPLYPARALRVASAAIDVDPADMVSLGKRPAPEVSQARWAVMLALSQRGMAMTRIGRRLGSDKNIVRYGLRRAQVLIAERDRDFCRLFREVDAA